MLFSSNRPLRIGTDCSGIETPIMALLQMKIPFIHEFSSEIDTYCVRTIQANFCPKIIFGDIMKRNLKDIPDIDMYVCGFPCQPFSFAGYRQGTDDPRGIVFVECLKVISYKKPILFVLENVRGLLTIDKGRTFKNIIRSLESLECYSVHWKILNTADYGIPQSRKRVFIVGILKTYQKKPFLWPTPIPMEPLENYIDYKDQRITGMPNNFIVSNMCNIINKNSIFINLGFPKHSHTQADVLCPCITTGCHSMYNYRLKRAMNMNEIMSLQGIQQPFHIVVSKSQLRKQVGNSISVNVLLHLFKNIFQTL
jgi:DNA (cytosine-5)-methyltransferase 1